uniref:Uncharacterized protein n=1 Tax=Siphoviridae sp. ctiMP24 TaxID=2825621 RepID=A0A8S5NZB0_9CAUD|nr:MAG TPA: hypothetical protein [Siphoviridae sp. ctiMP24]
MPTKRNDRRCAADGHERKMKDTRYMQGTYIML